MKKNMNLFTKVIIGLLAVIGAFFIILMLIPDEALESSEDANKTETSAAESVSKERDGYSDDEYGDEYDDEYGDEYGDEYDDEYADEYDDDEYADEYDDYYYDDGDLDSKNNVKKLNEAGYQFSEGKKLKDNKSADEMRELGIARENDTQTVGNGKDTVTFLIYMNGSNLETDDGEATRDIQEMIASKPSKNINILIQTMGTKEWKKYGISSDRAQRYKVTSDGLKLVSDDVGKVDLSEKDTLTDFIKWGAANYPADRYFLQFWDHGAGPVYGFGYDDKTDSEETLTLDEIQGALKEAGVYFDFIGMDCCIMAALETCCALYDYCDYTVLSEDFESGLGWSYTGFMTALRKDTSIATADLAKIAIDDMVKENVLNKSWGDSAILALIDESTMSTLYTAWKNFAYANENALLGKNYSRGMKRSKRAHPMLSKAASRNVISDVLDMEFDGWDFDTSDYYQSGSDEDNPNMADYYVTDIMSVAQTVDSKESKALSSALDAAIVYSNSTKNDKGLTGLSVTLPYGDSEFYQQLKTVFGKCGFDDEYIKFLSKFSKASGTKEFYDYSDWDDDWSGWDEYEDDYDWSDWDDYKDGSCQNDAQCQGWYDEFSYDDSYNCWLDEYYSDDDGINVDNYYSDDYGPDDYYYDDYYYDDAKEKHAELIY